MSAVGKLGRSLHATNAAVPREQPRSLSGATGVRFPTSTAISERLSEFTVNLAESSIVFSEGKTFELFLSIKSSLYNNFVFNY
jgi:hypothetical protein